MPRNRPWLWQVCAVLVPLCASAAEQPADAPPRDTGRPPFRAPDPAPNRPPDRPPNQPIDKTAPALAQTVSLPPPLPEEDQRSQRQPAPPPPSPQQPPPEGLPPIDGRRSASLRAIERPADPAPSALRNQNAAGAVRASERSAFGESGSPPPPSATAAGFDFGSYGRVSIASDLRGHSGYGVNVVSFGSRLEEQPYLELNFYYTGIVGEDRTGRWRVVVTPAFQGDLFHYTGKFTQQLALRDAYAETDNIGAKGLRLWAGSRMYRGDDVYLFDFWPLNNLNTVGGGFSYRFNQERTEIAVHAGMNRLDNTFQYQATPVPSDGLPQTGIILDPQPATQTSLLNDRPRLVTSYKLTHFFRKREHAPNAKLMLYAELHYLPPGQEQFPNAAQGPLPYPDDYGWVVGAQAGGWLRPFVFLNVFLRAAGGLAVYGDLGQPIGFNTDGRVLNALEVIAAFSSNWESGRLGVMTGGYFHHFRDANGADNHGFDEGALAARPILYLTRHIHLAAELSYQARHPVLPDPDTGVYRTPQVFRASLMPLVAPLGRGTYSRPMLYAVYTLSLLNDDAKNTLFYSGQYLTDVRYNNVAHYLGIGVEWWFNSSYR